MAIARNQFDLTTQFSLGEQLLQARQRAGATISDVAQVLQLMAPQVRAIENGSYETAARKGKIDRSIYDQKVRDYCELLDIDATATSTKSEKPNTQNRAKATTSNSTNTTKKTFAWKRSTLLLGTACTVAMLAGLVDWPNTATDDATKNYEISDPKITATQPQNINQEAITNIAAKATNNEITEKAHLKSTEQISHSYTEQDNDTSFAPKPETNSFTVNSDAVITIDLTLNENNSQQTKKVAETEIKAEAKRTPPSHTTEQRIQPEDVNRFLSKIKLLAHQK